MSATSPNKIVKSSRAALSWRRRETVAVVPSVPLLSHLSAAGSVPTPNQPRKGSSEVDKERERETTRASAESESRSTLEAGVGSASESSRRGEKRENMVVRALLNRIAEELPSAQSQDAAGQSRNTTSQILRASAREIEAVASTYLAEVVEGLLRELEAISKYRNDDFVSVDSLRSQLLLLIIIANCLAAACAVNNPAPLEEALAKRLCTISASLHKQYSTSNDGVSVGDEEFRSHSVPSLPALLPTRQSASSALYRQSTRIIFYISRTNWSVMSGRIRIKSYSNIDDSTDLTDLKLLECCDINRQRLSTVLQEISQIYPTLRKSTHQAAICIVVRATIWQWITYYSEEFADLIQSKRRFEAGTELLFDSIFASVAENSKKRIFGWPALTALLCLLPDSLAKLVLGDENRSSKKFQFFEALKKASKQSKTIDITLQCAIDLGRAAAFTRNEAGDPSILRLTVADFESDTKSKLFDLANPITSGDSESDLTLLISALVSLYQLGLADELLLGMLSKDAASSFKSVATAACIIIIRDESTMPWCQTLDSILPAVANSLRLLFVDDVRKSNELIEGANSTTGKTLKAVLDIWAVDLRYLFSYLPADTDIAGIILSLSALLDSPAMRSRAAIVLLSIYRSTSCDVLDSRRKIKMESLSEVYFAIARFTLDAGKEQRIIQLALNLLIVSAEASPSQLPRGCWTAIEISLLLFLASPDLAIRDLAVSGFVRVNTRLSQMRIEPSSDSQDALETFRRFGSPMSSFDSINTASISNVLLSLSQSPSVGLLAAWDEAYACWNYLLRIIFPGAEYEDAETELQATEHFNCETVRTLDENIEEWIILTSFLLSTAATGAFEVTLDLIIPKDKFSKRFYRVRDRKKDFIKFSQELVDLLVAEDVIIRDAVKNLLGNQLQPLYINVFIQHFNAITSPFLAAEDEVDEAFTFFIEQATATLRQLFEREWEREIILAAPLENALLSITTYLDRLGNVDRATNTLRDLCALCEAIALKKLELTPRNRLILVEFLIRARSDGAAFDYSRLVALTSLLDALRIWQSHSEIPDPQLFERCHVFFYRILRSLPKIESPQDRVLRQLAITALSNLIAANPGLAAQKLAEIGVVRGSGVAERGDNLDILKRVVEKGASFEFSQVEELQSKLLAILTASNLSLALVMAEVSASADFEDLCDLFTKIFRSSRLIKALIEREVSLTEHEASLFRSNTFTTRILTSYARTQGYGYLRHTLRDLLLSLCEAPSTFTMDFDPHSPPSEKDEVAIKNLQSVAEAFLSTIRQSISEVPLSLREICSFIGAAVGKKFPESVFTAIGGFVFLRFINPAIVSPERIDLDLPEENREIRRGLVMITKVLQALANNVRFGSKEMGMAVMNEWMDVNIYGVTRFLQAISISPRTIESPIDVPSLDTFDFGILHRFLLSHRDKIDLVLSKTKEGSRTKQQLGAVLASLSNFSRSSLISQDPSYAAFASRMRLRHDRPSDSVLNSIFYRVYGNTSGLSTFCLLLARIEGQDFESVAYFILNILSQCPGDFELLIDCTRYRNATESLATTAHLIRLIPALCNRIARIILLNPNTILKRDLRAISRILSDHFDFRRFVSIGLKAISEYFVDSSFLPSSTISLGREKSALFNSILEIGVDHPLQLRIGRKSLIISTAKKQELFPQSDIKCSLYDIIDLVDIDEVRSIDMPEGEGFSIALMSIESVLPRRFLVSRGARDEIVELIAEARSSMLMSSMFEREIIPKPLRSDTALATFINSALLNLCSDSSEIRVKALNLTGVIAKRYGLAGFETIYPEETFVPSSLGLIVGISERLVSAASNSALAILDQFSTVIPLASNPALYLHAVRPWLQSHLLSLAYAPRESTEEMQATLRRFIRTLIKFSSNDVSVHTVCVSRIWPAIGKIDFIIPLFLQEIIRWMSESQLESANELGGDIVTALSAGMMVRGKVIARLRQAISRASVAAPTLTLIESPEWNEIYALFRLDLALSFNQTIQTQLLLPEIFTVVTSLYSTSSSVRSLIRQMLINTIGSLSLDTSENVDAIGLNRTLEVVVTDSLGWFSSDDSSESLRGLVRMMMDVMEQAATSTDQSNHWRSRWTSLIVASVFQRSPSLQPNAFVALSILAQKASDGDLMYQILASLVTTLRLAYSTDVTLAANIIDCISMTLAGLDRESSFWPNLLGISIRLIQVGNRQIGIAAAKLLEVVLVGLEGMGAFETDTFEEYVMDVLKPQLSFDEAAGIDFHRSFSFSLATLLSRVGGDEVERVMFRLVTPSANSSAYILALLPVYARIGQLSSLFMAAGMTGGEMDSYRQIATDLVESKDTTFALDLLTALASSCIVSQDYMGLVPIYRMISVFPFEVCGIEEKVLEMLLKMVQSSIAMTSSIDLLKAANSALLQLCCVAEPLPPSFPHFSTSPATSEVTELTEILAGMARSVILSTLNPQ